MNSIEVVYGGFTSDFRRETLTSRSVVLRRIDSIEVCSDLTSDYLEDGPYSFSAVRTVLVTILNYIDLLTAPFSNGAYAVLDSQNVLEVFSSI
jgi:hypothetical protein